MAKYSLRDSRFPHRSRARECTYRAPESHLHTRCASPLRLYIRLIITSGTTHVSINICDQKLSSSHTFQVIISCIRYGHGFVMRWDGSICTCTVACRLRNRMHHRLHDRDSGIGICCFPYGVRALRVFWYLGRYVRTFGEAARGTRRRRRARRRMPRVPRIRESVLRDSWGSYAATFTR